MATGVAWVLNLDADLELAATRSYAPSHRVLLAMKPHIQRLCASLLGPDDRLVEEASTAGCARGLAGRAFCPTPRALKLLLCAGAEPEAHPSMAVLRTVNSRAFASSLGTTLPGAVFVSTASEAHAVIRGAPLHADSWRMKYAFGMAGRNQRVAPAGIMRREDEAFLQRGIRAGGVQIEPNVAVVVEYAMHGVVDAEGSLSVGALVRQRCDSRGAWLSTERVEPSAPGVVEVKERMSAEIRVVGRALFRVGYFGPFGVDAYSYRDRGGATLFQPRSEINARYSMGFSVGFPRSV